MLLWVVVARQDFRGKVLWGLRIGELEIGDFWRETADVQGQCRVSSGVEIAQRGSTRDGYYTENYVYA